jgi:hypothetical protein
MIAVVRRLGRPDLRGRPSTVVSRDGSGAIAERRKMVTIQKCLLSALALAAAHELDSATPPAV